MNRIRLAAMVLCFTSAAHAQSARSGPILLRNGNLDSKSEPIMVAFAPNGAAIGASVTLRIDNPDGIDLDVDVYDRNPRRDSSAVAVCSSNGDGAIETCRAFRRNGTDSLWIEVSVNDGQRGSAYTLEYTPLFGERLQGTDLTTRDARNLTFDRYSMGAFRESENDPDPLRQLFQVEGIPTRTDSIIATLQARTRGDLVRLDLFDGGGHLLRGSRVPSEVQQIKLDTMFTPPLFILATLASRRLPGFIARLNPSMPYAGVGFNAHVGPRTNPIPILLSTLPFRDESSGQRVYDVRLPAGHTAVVTLDGTSHQMVTSAGDLTLVERDTALFGTKTSLRIGKPWRGAQTLRYGVDTDQNFRIRVQENREGAKYGRSGSWAVTMRAFREERPSLISFSPDRAVVWEPSSIGTLSLNKNIPIIENAMAVAVVYAPRAADMRTNQSAIPNRALTSSGSRVTAQLGKKDDVDFDLVVCDDSGAIIDIGSNTVSWQWTSDRPYVFLVAMPDPSRFATRPPPGVGARRMIEMNLIGLGGSSAK